MFTTSGKIAMRSSPCPGLPLAAELWLRTPLAVASEVWDDAGYGTQHFIFSWLPTPPSGETATAELLLSLLLPVAWHLWSL